MEKKLGKIQEVHIGIGGYSAGMIGFNFTLGSDSGYWGVSTEWEGHWAIERSDTAKWTESERIENLGIAFMTLAKLLKDANKTDVYSLKGTPIEATFDGMVLKEWRILKEVI